MILAISLLNQRQSQQAIEYYACCPRIGSGLASYLVCLMKTLADQAKEVVLDGGIKNLAIGEIPQYPH